MTISSTVRRKTYAGDSSTTVFPYDFKILNDADIVLQIKNDSTGVITTKTLTTHYTVSGAGDAAGGNVTTTVGNTPATGNTVIITSALSYTQPTDYNEYDTFPASSHETALDRATILVQQQKEITDRCLKLDPSNADFDATFPDPVASKVVRINDDGDGFEFVSLSDLESYSISTGTGFLAQISADSAMPRTLTGTANEITITNGTGVAGAPVFSIPPAVTFTGKTVTGGTFTNPILSGATGTVSLDNTGLKALDTDASHSLTIKPGSNLTANRTYTITTGDADRTFTLSGDLTVSSSATISGTNTGDQTVPAAATQTEQEAAASTTTYVSPGRQQFHPSAAKFFVTADASGNIQQSYNMTSISDGGAGLMSGTIATDFSGTSWEIATTAFHSSVAILVQGSAKAAGTFTVQSRAASGLALADPESWNVVGFGDQ